MNHLKDDIPENKAAEENKRYSEEE